MFVLICLLLAHPFFVLAKTQTWKSVFNFEKPACYMIKLCNLCLTSTRSFMLQTKHFHWFNQHSCLGNCHVWKVNMCEKMVTLDGWTQMVVFEFLSVLSSEYSYIFFLMLLVRVCLYMYLVTPKYPQILASFKSGCRGFLFDND